MNTKPYLALALVAGLGLALGACSSSSDDPPAMPDLTLDGVQMGTTVMEGTHTISADLAEAFDDVDEATAAKYLGVDHPEGTTIEIAGLDFRCTAGPCSVTVAPDGSHITTTGTISVAMHMAEMEPDPEEVQTTAITSAIATAQTAVAAVNDESDDATVTAAEAAVAAAEKAITDAADVSDAAKAGYTTAVQTLASRLTAAKTARQTAMNAADDAASKETTATAKALKAAIDIPKRGTDGTTVVPATGTGAITPTNIPVLDADGEAGTNEATEVDTVAITLKKGDAVDSLGNWKGTDYAGMQTPTGPTAKNTGMVRAYANQGAAKSVTFASEAGEAVHGWDPATATATVVGDYTVDTTDTSDQEKVGGFPTTGTTSYDNEDTVTGTFMKASGTYTCTADAGCTSVVIGDGINLGTGWTFLPAPGATLQQPDANYLQFGWWIRKDKDGPTHAGAFYRPVGLTALTDAVINSAALVGKATYAGKAAGKFAVSDPLRPAEDNAGHFTANAALEADFKATGSTLTGTIDAFRLNDGSDDPGWSIELQKAGFTSPSFGTGTTPDGDQTVWSINGAKAAASGAWEAQMFDEAATGAADDGSNVPTSVIGSFNSKIGSTHSMVGAFGAEKQ